MFRYRLTPAGPDDDRSDYEMEDEKGNRVEVTAKSYYRRLANALLSDEENAPADAKPCFVELIEKGCDPHRLRASLLALRWTDSLVSRHEVHRTAKIVRDAADQIFEIELSGLRSEVDPHREFVGLSQILREYARRLISVEPLASKRHRVQHDKLLASLVCHVKKQTDDWGDEEIAPLISTFLGVPYSDEAHAKWRRRNATALAKCIAAEPDRPVASEKRGQLARRLWNDRSRQSYVPTALLAARRLYPEKGWSKRRVRGAELDK